MNLAEQRVLVVGAGLVGATAALGLAQRGAQVTLLDRHVPEVTRGQLGVDIRNVALNHQSRALLAALGVWPSDPTPYSAMHVWEHFGQGRLHFEAADAGVSELGWILEASPLQHDLWQACERAGVQLCTGDFEALDISADAAVVQAGGQRLQADFVLAVDGARSPMRAHLGLDAENFPVPQHALATVVRCELPHGGVARQRFLADGPLALLPSAKPDCVSVVWSQSSAQAAAHQGLGESAFADLLTRCSEACLGRVVEVDARLTFPLTQQAVPQLLAEDRVLFLGDAARVVHPLAGLGVNLGFEDVLLMLKLAEQGGLYGNPAWVSYVRRRYSRSQQLIGLLGTLRAGYALQGPVAALVRNWGAGLLDRAPWLKGQIMREAMGLGPLSKVTG